MEQSTREKGNVKVTSPIDCGNAPKKLLLKALTIGFAKREFGTLKEYVAENIHWQIVGDKHINGKCEFENELLQMESKVVTEVRLASVITHGNTGAVNGSLILKDNNSIAFCDIYTFTGAGKNAKVKDIVSYRIEENSF